MPLIPVLRTLLLYFAHWYFISFTPCINHDNYNYNLLQQFLRRTFFIISIVFFLFFLFHYCSSCFYVTAVHTCVHVRLYVLNSFVLKISALRKDGVWVECHERMARWFVFMDHHMKHESGDRSPSLSSTYIHLFIYGRAHNACVCTLHHVCSCEFTAYTVHQFNRDLAHN